LGFTTPVTTAEPVVTDSDTPVEAVGAAWKSIRALVTRAAMYMAGVGTRGPLE
jgi:hypothetical protein